MNKLILIATDNLTVSSQVAEALDRHNYTVLQAKFDGQTLHDAPKVTPSAILIHLTDYVEMAPTVKLALSQRYAPAQPPYIAAFSRYGNIDTDLFDCTLLPPIHPVQIGQRIDTMVRLSALQTEIALRIDTLKESFDIDYVLPEDFAKRPLRVLFVGKPTPDFMVLINAMEENHVDVIAAFTSFSAFDFLHDGNFDAVVVNALDGPEPGVTLIETMRRNSSLYHVPVIFLTGENFTDIDLAYDKGAADLIQTKLPQAEIRGRVVELANFHRMQRALRREFENMAHRDCYDISGTYNFAFLKAHLKKISTFYRDKNVPVSLIEIDLIAPQEKMIVPDRLNIALSQAGRMLCNIIRVEDMTARARPNRYVMVFPGQSAADVKTIAKRITLSLAAFAFETGTADNPSFTFEAGIKISQLTPEADIEHVLRKLISDNSDIPEARQVRGKAV